MKPKQVERLENMVFKMDTLTQKFDEEHEDFWSQVKADIEALSLSPSVATRHFVEGGEPMKTVGDKAKVARIIEGVFKHHDALYDTRIYFSNRCWNYDSRGNKKPFSRTFGVRPTPNTPTIKPSPSRPKGQPTIT